MKFTTEQQQEIAAYAIDNNNDYKATGEKYGISYQQVAAWVRKYQKADASPKEKKATTTSTVAEQQEPAEATEEASTLDVLSRRDPVLEKQLEDVKRRLGLIK